METKIVEQVLWKATLRSGDVDVDYLIAAYNFYQAVQIADAFRGSSELVALVVFDLPVLLAMPPKQ